MKKAKGEKVISDTVDHSGWIGSMKDSLKINGDIFSTGAWPSDEQLESSYIEQAAHIEAETEALERSEALIGDVGDEPQGD